MLQKDYVHSKKVTYIPTYVVRIIYNPTQCKERNGTVLAANPASLSADAQRKLDRPLGSSGKKQGLRHFN